MIVRRTLCLLLFWLACSAWAETAKPSINTLLDQVSASLVSQLEQTPDLLAQLQSRVDELDPDQQSRYMLLKSSYLGLAGKHAERVQLVRSVLDQVTGPDRQVKFLYQLSDGYIALGDFEQALSAMNRGLKLLPRLTDINAKVSILQGAVTLLSSLQAYDEAKGYAERMYAIGVQNDHPGYICQGLANQVEVHFQQRASAKAREQLREALTICRQGEIHYIADILQASSAVDHIDNHNLDIGIPQATEALAVFERNNSQSDYVGVLEEALARGYLARDKMAQAERYAGQAYRRALASQSHDTIRQASLTLAQIKRAQGELEQALGYYDVYLKEKDNAQQVRFAKNLAYQRVKYDNLDKTNQLELLRVKNNTLSLTQKLHQRNNENLVLMLFLGAVLLLFMSILLVFLLKRRHRVVIEQPGEASLSFEQMGRQGERFCVMLFELDVLADFDQLVSESESAALVGEVASICRNQIRSGDQFGRISEHRFSLCLLDTTTEGAVALARRCRQAIAELVIDGSHLPSPLTTTFGVAMIGEAQVAFDDALNMAEIALQRAKTRQNDALYVYHPGQLSPSDTND